MSDDGFGAEQGVSPTNGRLPTGRVTTYEATQLCTVTEDVLPSLSPSPRNADGAELDAKTKQANEEAEMEVSFRDIHGLIHVSNTDRPGFSCMPLHALSSWVLEPWLSL